MNYVLAIALSADFRIRLSNPVLPLWDVLSFYGGLFAGLWLQSGAVDWRRWGRPRLPEGSSSVACYRW